MNNHTYVAADMHHAMKLVKEDMGPDAVILSQRSVMEGVEIVAAPAEAMEALQQLQPQLNQQRKDQARSGQPQGNQPPLNAAQPVPIATAIESMIASDRGTVANDVLGLNTPQPGAAASLQQPEKARSFSFPGLPKRPNTDKPAVKGVPQASLRTAKPKRSASEDVTVSLSSVQKPNPHQCTTRGWF